MSPMTPGPGPSEEAIASEARAESERREARRAWLRGETAREARARSRQRHQGIGPDAARSLAVDAFAGLLNGLAGTASLFAQQGRFLEFFDDYTARVRVGDASQVVRSWLPLRVRDSDGQKRPVDLSLHERDGGFEPRVPLVPVSLPASLDEPVRVGSERIPVWVEGTRPGAAARDGALRLFYWETSPDTDVVVLPTQMGVEVLWQIRGPQSPEEFSLRFDLPPGAELERAQNGAIRVARAGETVVSIRPPHVVDAQGEQVEALTEVAGERAVFRVAHRAADVAYPLALDPPIEDHDGWYWGDPSGIWLWGFSGQGGHIGGSWACYWGNPCYSPGRWGLYLIGQPAWYGDWETGNYTYTVPGETSYISRADFNYMVFDWAGQCCASMINWNGLWDFYRNTWAAVTMVNYPFAYRYSTLYAGPGSRSAAFGFASQGAGYRNWINAYAGSVLLYLDDQEAPSLSVANETRSGSGTGGWHREGSISITTTTRDRGLGIRRMGVDGPASVPSESRYRTLPCSGSWSGAICPGDAADTVTIPVSSLPEGVTTLTAFAEDATGKRGTRGFPMRVDRAAPTIAFSGSLYDHRDRPLNESDTYALRVRAQDSACSSDGQRSGVANVEIQVDAITRASYPLAAVGRCVHEVDWTYRTADYGPGEHAVTVIVTDHVGHRRARHLRPIYVAAPAADAGEPVEGLAAAAGIAEENVEQIPSPKPNLMPMWRDTASPGKGYFGSGFTQPRVAVGGGRVFVSGPGGIKSFDAAEPAIRPVETFTSTPAPGGIAYYRDRVYAVGDHRIDVYDPETGGRRTDFGQASQRCQDGTLAAGGEAAQDACDASGLSLKRPQGIDVAWGKLFVADEAGEANADVVRAYTADTGIPIGLSANGDPNPSFRDVSTAPDQGLFFDGRRASSWLAGATIPWFNSGPLLDGYEVGTLPPTSPADLDWCECYDIRGTDAVWGMNWLLATTGNGTLIEEFGPSVRKRMWAPKQTNGSVSDIAYHKREERIEGTGDLLESSWINHTQELTFVASDADIFVMGNQGEHWLEQVRNLDYVQLLVNDVPLPHSINGVPSDAQHKSYLPGGTLTFDTHLLESNPIDRDTGEPQPYTLKLVARLTSGKVLSLKNPNLRIDHTPPSGTVAGIARVVRESVLVTGSLEDAHSGPREWRFQIRSAGQSAWTDVPSCPGILAPGPYACNWNTRDHPDGRYEVHSRLTDLTTDQHANVGPSNVVETIIDNQAPSLSVSGGLWDRSNGKSTFESERPPLRVDASDPASGVRRVEIFIDGVRADGIEQPCESGGCPMPFSYTFNPQGHGTGSHTVRVVATDHAGWQSERSWSVFVRRNPPDAPDESATDPADQPGPTSPEPDEPADNIPPGDGAMYEGGTYAQPECADDDPYLVIDHLDYPEPAGSLAIAPLQLIGSPTPEAALTRYLAQTALLPPMPATAFTRATVADASVLFVGLLGGAPRAWLEAEKAPDGSWIASHLFACSQFVDSYIPGVRDQ